MTDEEYEAELQARTPERWDAMREKALADAEDIQALHHLMWRRDVKDWESLLELTKPGMTLEDRDYFLRQVGEIADTLRTARDDADKRERDRWHRLMFAAACIGSSKEEGVRDWLESARDLFPPTRGPQPGDDDPLLAHAVYAVESLLDALLLEPEDRAELKGKMDGALMKWLGENGIRAGKFNANGRFEMLGEIVPFEPRNNDEPPPISA